VGLIATLLMSATVQAETTNRIDYTIDRQSADKALVEFARQSGLSVLFPTEAISQLTTSPVRGTYAVDEALAILLRDSGLSGELSATGVLKIKLDTEEMGSPEMKQTTGKNWFSMLLGTLGAAMSYTASAQSTTDPSDTVLSEIVVISTGYVQEKKKDLIGAVSAVDLEQVKDRPAGNIMRNLQGEVPGVQIITDGNPVAGATVRIRGQGLGPLGFNDPLFIVDGVPLNVTSGMQEINSNDIESVQVLRDAASASIYGARAANGVVVITTKKGAPGMTLTIKAAQSRESFNYDIHPLNTQQRALAWYRASINSGFNPNNALYSYNCGSTAAPAACTSSNPTYNSVTIGQYTDTAGNRYIDPALTQRVSDTNWFNAVTEDSKIVDSSVTLSNATDKSRFYTSLGFYDAHGIVRNSEFKRVTFRLNADHKLFDDRLTIGDNFMISDQRENAVNANASFILNQAIETQSIIPIRTADGKGWGGPAAGTTDHRQPVEILTDTQGNVSRLNKVLGNVYAEWQIIDGLTFRGSVGVDYSQKYYRNYTPGGYTGNVLLVDNLTTSDGWNRSTTVTDTLNYTHTFGSKHNVGALLGYETIDFSAENFAASGSGFASPDQSYTFLSQATQNVTAGGGGDAWALKSYFTKLNYDYDGKYLAAVTIRRDGSSRFGANNRYGIFPSGAVGWRLSQEPFFKVDFVNDLKLRASVGTNGNQEISSSAASTVYQSRYSTTSLFADFPCCQQETGTAYDLTGANTGTLPSGFAKSQTGNPNLKWETSKQVNFGLDFAMFDNKVDGSIDVYTKRTSDILTVTQPLATAGEGAQQVVNGGTVDNKGWELGLGYKTAFNFQKLSAPINFHVGANLSHSSNKVVSLPKDVVNSFPGNGSTDTILGRSVNSLYGFLGNGIFQNQAEVNALNQPGAYVGGLRITDVNGDGKIDAKDRVFYGSTDPKYLFGVNFTASFKAWDFNMSWQGVQGGLVDNYWKHFTDFTENPGSNYGGRVLDAWSPSNTSSTIPALSRSYGVFPDTYFHEDASYIKLRNLSVSYNAPDAALKWAHMKQLRVYLRGENLVLIKHKGTVTQDPETVGSGFPVPKRYTLGFEASF
jgi:TonB-linked SusC/RagA family outer membrane protein